MYIAIAHASHLLNIYTDATSGGVLIYLSSDLQVDIHIYIYIYVYI